MGFYEPLPGAAGARDARHAPCLNHPRMTPLTIWLLMVAFGVPVAMVAIALSLRGAAPDDWDDRLPAATHGRFLRSTFGVAAGSRSVETR